MSQYNDDNTVVLFKNDKYEVGGNKPIYKGNAVFNGTKLNMSVWLKEANGEGKLPKGTKFLSGVFDDWQPEGQRGNNSGQGGYVNSRQNQSQPPADDDIPF